MAGLIELIQYCGETWSFFAFFQDSPTKPSQSGMILGAVNKEGIWQTAQDAYRRTGDESLSREQRWAGDFVF